MKITRIIGREIYDSRGMPTLECELFLEEGFSVTSSVASGASKGQFEAKELRDTKRLSGHGVADAIENLENVIAPVLIGKEPEAITMDLHMIELDGTTDKSKLGANAILAASMSVFRAQALVAGVEPYELAGHLCDFNSVSLPFPMFNLLNGGMHADNGLLIQEIMAIPVGAQSFRDSMEAGFVLNQELKHVLKEKKRSTLVGDEGGFAPQCTDEIEALDIMTLAIQRAQEKTGLRYVIALDMAASQFYDYDKKIYRWHDQQKTTQELVDWYEKLANTYPLYSIEDGCSDVDFEGWKELTNRLGEKVLVIGDDLFATNQHRIVQGLEQGLATGVVIKPNQIGTVTETLQAIKLCKAYDLQTILSHRSGETNDTFIVDLVVGCSVPYIKAGGFSRGERMAKYNQLMRIEDFLMFSLLGS
jgi:enolase